MNGWSYRTLVWPKRKLLKRPFYEMTQSGMTRRTHGSPVKSQSGPVESFFLGPVEAYFLPLSPYSMHASNTYACFPLRPYFPFLHCFQEASSFLSRSLYAYRMAIGNALEDFPSESLLTPIQQRRTDRTDYNYSLLFRTP